MVRITPNASSEDGVEQQWIMINDESVFVSIDIATGYVENLSVRLRDGIVFEIGPCRGFSGCYPAFLISDVDRSGNVLSRKYITKSTGEWVVEDC